MIETKIKISDRGDHIAVILDTPDLTGTFFAESYALGMIRRRHTLPSNTKIPVTFSFEGETAHAEFAVAQ